MGMDKNLKVNKIKRQEKGKISFITYDQNNI